MGFNFARFLEKRRRTPQEWYAEHGITTVEQFKEAMTKNGFDCDMSLFPTTIQPKKEEQPPKPKARLKEKTKVIQSEPTRELDNSDDRNKDQNV